MTLVSINAPLPMHKHVKRGNFLKSWLDRLSLIFFPVVRMNRIILLVACLSCGRVRALVRWQVLSIKSDMSQVWFLKSIFLIQIGDKAAYHDGRTSPSLHKIRIILCTMYDICFVCLLALNCTHFSWPRRET